MPDHAASVDAHAAISIVSCLKKREISGDTTFEYRNEFPMAGLTPRRDIVLLAGR